MTAHGLRQIVTNPANWLDERKASIGSVIGTATRFCDILHHFDLSYYGSPSYIVAVCRKSNSINVAEIVGVLEISFSFSIGGAHVGYILL
jgi:hypothetical protein